MRLLASEVIPEIDGARLTRTVFWQHDLKVLYMTGGPRAVLLGQNIQIDNDLTKPFTLHQFARAAPDAFDRPIKA